MTEVRDDINSAMKRRLKGDFRMIVIALNSPLVRCGTIVQLLAMLAALLKEAPK